MVYFEDNWLIILTLMVFNSREIDRTKNTHFKM